MNRSAPDPSAAAASSATEPDYIELHRRRRSSNRRTWLIILALFVIINGGALIGPLLYHRADRERLIYLQGYLTAQRSALETESRYLRLMQAELERLRSATAPLKKSIESTEKKHPKGVPAALYEKYLRSIYEYNAKVEEQNRRQAELQSLQRDHRTHTGEYEQASQEAKSLAAKIRSSWSVVPPPSAVPDISKQPASSLKVESPSKAAPR